MIRVTAGWAMTSVLVAASCRGEPPPLVGPVVVTPATPAEPGAYSPAGDKHPGQIVYEDHVEHRTWTRDAIDVPATIAWVLVGARWRPVVLVEIDGTGQRREITTYGPNREFLEHTTAHLAAPPPRPAVEPVPQPAPAPPPQAAPEPR